MKTLKALLALLNIVATILFLYFTGHLAMESLGFSFLFYVVSSTGHLLAHESGHFIGGSISGYKLLCIQIGPIYSVFDKSRIIVNWKRPISGQCIMYPTKVGHLHFKLYNLGGVIANSMLIVLSSILLSFRSFGAALLFVEVLLVGIKKIAINLIPCKTNTGPNDGYVVMLLKRGRAVQKDYAMYLKLFASILLDRSISLQEYVYEREETDRTEELLYYNEIQKLLTVINTYRV